MRKLVIGDIHGALKALEQVLERAKYNPVLDKLIFLGDYVDGWSESAELIEYLINLKEKSKSNNVDPDPVIFLLGNHDKWCKDWLNSGHSSINWTENGGNATIQSYIRTGYLVKQSHKDFFNQCLSYYIDDQNRGFVHGGYTSRKGLGYEDYEADYYWDRDLWTLALMTEGRFHEEPKPVKDGMPSSRRFERHKELYIGHTPTMKWNCKSHYPEWTSPNQALNGPITVPMRRCNVWNMDTGAGWSGKLTIMDIDTKEYFQSDFVKELYPDEKGR